METAVILLDICFWTIKHVCLGQTVPPTGNNRMRGGAPAGPSVATCFEQWHVPGTVTGAWTT